MRADVDRKELRDGLRRVLPAVPKGGSLAVLQGVKIECHKTGFDLVCSSLDLTIATCVDAPSTTPGEAVVPAALLARIVDKMAGEKVTLESGDDGVTVTSGETVASLRCLRLEDWPKVVEPEGEPTKLDAETVGLIGRILPMVSVDQNRPVITGVYIGNGQAAATDSYRLGVVDGLPPELGPAIVPGAAVAAVVEWGGEVEVQIDDRHVRFASGPTTWTVRLIEGDFPNFPSLVRADEPFSLTFSRWAMSETVARMRTLGAESTNGVVLTRDGDKLTVSVTDTEVGSLADVVGCSGTWVERARCNLSHLGQLLAALDGDEVTLNLAGGLKPVQARSGRMLQLLAPMQVAG